MLSVAVGLWAGMFVLSVSWGLYKEQVQDVIEKQLSHIQIHHPKFQEDRMAQYTISKSDFIRQILLKDSRVKGIARRNSTSGMISSSACAAGVEVTGIISVEEKNVSSLYKYITKGNYFFEGRKNGIIIGEKLAEKLGVHLKNKIVLTFQSATGEITAGSFHITGLFRTGNSVFDEYNVYTNFNDLAVLLGTGNGLHEIAVLLKDDTEFENVANTLKEKFPQNQIQTWKELAPELQLIVDSFNQYMYIFIAIILMALMFGIVNTMLMAVLERQREFGVLMAIGMNRIKIFSMIQLETVLLTCAGIPLGLLLAFASIEYFHQYGIDYTAFSKGFSRYGFSPVIRPEIQSSYYISVALMTACSSIISAIYPAIKALQLKPTEAITKI